MYTLIDYRRTLICYVNAAIYHTIISAHGYMRSTVES